MPHRVERKRARSRSWGAPLIGAVVVVLLVNACDDPRERSCRQAVRQLVESGPGTKEAALAAVKRYGAFALVDIEQALHGAEVAQQLVLLEAVEQISSAEGLPLLSFYAQWGKPALRKPAAEARRRLAASSQR